MSEGHTNGNEAKGSNGEERSTRKPRSTSFFSERLRSAEEGQPANVSCSVPKHYGASFEKISERFPLYFFRSCMRLTSQKLRSPFVKRVVCLAPPGFLLIFTVDANGKRVESLFKPDCLHRILVSADRSKAMTVVFYFQKSKDLAIDFAPLDPQYDDPLSTNEAFLELIGQFLTKDLKAALSERNESKTFYFEVPARDTLFKLASHLQDTFKGHGPVVSTAPSQHELLPSTTSTPVPTLKSITDSAPVTSADSPNLFLGDTISPVAEKREHSPVIPRVKTNALHEGAILEAEEFLLEEENRKLQEELTWLSEQTTVALEGETRERRRRYRDFALRSYQSRQLDFLVTTACRRVVQKKQQQFEVANEQAYCVAMRLRRDLQNPEEKFGCISSTLPYASKLHHHRSLIDDSRLDCLGTSSIDPLDLFDVGEDNNVGKAYHHGAAAAADAQMSIIRNQSASLLWKLLGSADDVRAVGRSAVLHDSNGRITSLGEPLSRPYRGNISELL